MDVEGADSATGRMNRIAVIWSRCPRRLDGLLVQDAVVKEMTYR